MTFLKKSAFSKRNSIFTKCCSSSSPYTIPTKSESLSTTFKLKLFQFLQGNHNTYTNFETQLLYAGSLLSGSAGQWYQFLVDPTTLQLPCSYTLDTFFQELVDFFGGGVTLQSRKRSLDVRPTHTSSVSKLGIAFQNITSTFLPR